MNTDIKRLLLGMAVCISSASLLIACGNGATNAAENKQTTLLAASDSSPPTTGQWTFCANENGACIFTGTQTVRYGSGTNFVSKSLAWGATCNNATFGDPAPGATKHCEVTSTWAFCSNENTQCGFGDTRTVRYGAGSAYVTQTLTGGTACNNNVFGDPAPGATKHCDSTATTWTLCADEGGRCTFTGTKPVLYGANGSFWVKTLTGGAPCTNATFGGDPISGAAKKCYIPGGGSTSTPPPPPPSGWKQVWNDEFNGPNIDTGKWSFEVNGTGGGNNELQYYTSRPENARIENGHLVIEARKEQYTGPDGTRQYTSGRLRTLNKGDWTYGRFEASIKLPAGQGMWPAFWMLPSDNAYGAWAASGEIDIMEAINSNAAGGNNVYGSIHFGGSWPNNTHTTAGFNPASSVVSNYHVYAVEWEPSQIRWYVDNVLYSTQTNWSSSGGPYPAPFNKRFHILLNLAVGGAWPGNPDGSTAFPQRMEVDYVRVFQK